MNASGLASLALGKGTAMETIPLLSLGLLAICLTACGKSPTAMAHAEKSPQYAAASRQVAARGVLTRAEVSAILGQPVTSAEGAATDIDYKTATVSLETTIGIENGGDSAQSMAGARKATGMLGGTPEDVPHLGDDAFFGAMSVLYVRKGDSVITIQPPNYQQIAAMASYDKVTETKIGSPEQAEAMNDFMKTESHDPLQAGQKSSDVVQGTLAAIAAVSEKRGTPEEVKGRAVAVSLATKVLSKL
jgi:hypothetical protein